MTERSINNLIIPSYAKKILDIGEDKDDEKEKIVALPTATSVTSTKSSYLNPNRLNILLKKPKYKMKTKEELNSDKLLREIDSIKEEIVENFKKSVKKDFLSPAIYYAQVGDEEGLKKCIIEGHNPNERDPQTGRTILHEATARGDINLVSLIVLGHRATWEIERENKYLNAYFPKKLHEREREALRSEKVNNYLSDIPLDLDRKTSMGDLTSLHLAVIINNRAIASMLLGRGSTLWSFDSQGNSPLHYATSESLIRLLLKNDNILINQDLEAGVPLHSLTPLILRKNNKGQLPSEYYLANITLEEKKLSVIDLFHNAEKQALSFFSGDTSKKVLLEIE